MKNKMLKKFMDAKEKEITDLISLEVQGGLELDLDFPRLEFAKALKKNGPALIAEYKRASPSKGLINSALSASDAADMFVRGGADAFSVLTERDYFQGEIDFLDVFAFRNIPALRKDFLFHPVQIKQTAATKAAALLLIVRVVQQQELLAELVRMSFDFNIEPVVEIFNEEELSQARKAGARVILINNRDLDTLLVDLNVSRGLA
ncbi:MAG: indole-3-glycerol-phosphate synthase, partial [Desulfovibrionales bacterium]|nr:indole-3-glycerol-phosphate synthase [Desulfovibrionales bacterium]